MKDSGEDLLDDFLSVNFRDGACTIQATQPDFSTVVLTIEPANLQAMLATQFNDFETQRYNVFKPLLGRSIFNSDGAFWAHSRALFRPQFARENINDLEATNSASSELIAALGPVGDDGWTKGDDMLPLFYNFTLDTATDFLFGESANSQAAAATLRDIHGEDYHPNTNEVQKAQAVQSFSDSFPLINDTIMSRANLQKLWWLGDGFAFRRALRTVKDFAEHFVQLALSADRNKLGGKKNSLLDNLVSQTQDHTELRDQSLAILLAGRDTTAAFLGWTFVRLALHPEIFTKLRHAIVEDFADNERITFATLKSCKPLQNFLSEVLRLHPILPYNGRVATTDTTLPVGGGPDQTSPIAIRRGQIVAFNVYFMHRRVDLWGPDAGEFRPDRWAERTMPAWQFLPFLGGPRVCLGQQFALTEVGCVVVRFLREFEAVEPVDSSQMAKLRKGYGITMTPGDGVRVRWRRAKSVGE